MRTVAIIPARSGSKRLPRKNVMEFMGRPMMAHTIAAARDCGLFVRIIVSTDDAEIARIAEGEGAQAPVLRDRHSDDHAPVSLATLRALEQIRGHYLEDYDVVVQLMPNCPLRGANEIKSAMSRFASGDASFLISAFRFMWMNPWWAVTLDSQNRPQPIFDMPPAGRSQDLPPLYCPSGAIWIARTKALEQAQTFYGPGHAYCVFPWDTMVDIDDRDDLAFAEAVWLRRQRAPEQTAIASY